MIRKAFIIALAASLSACATIPANIPASPSAVASRTVLDETAGLKFEQSITAAANLATLAIQTGIVRDPATIAKIHATVPKARAAVAAVRTAIETVNAESYREAFAKASKLIAEIQTLASGDVR